MHCSIWGASFFAFLEETRVSLGAFVFRRQALSFFKTAIFRFPDYTFSPEEYVQLVSGAFYLRLEKSVAYGNQRLKKR